MNKAIMYKDRIEVLNYYKDVAPVLKNFLHNKEIAAKNYYRPRSGEIKKKYASQFPEVELFTIDEVFGGWDKAQKEHFDDGGVFDQIYEKK